MSRSFEVAAKKHLGQYFLRDSGVLDRMVRNIQPTPQDVILEIGAGKGALSGRLASRVARLLAVEIDHDCLGALEAVLAPYPQATVLNEDVMKMDIGDAMQPFLDRGLKARVVGNLPYYLATAIIERLLRPSLPLHDMNFLVQLEVAERITSAPGTREYGFFTVYCQHLSDVAMGFRVPPACFVPRPKVMSGTVTLRPKLVSRDPAAEKSFAELVKAAFAHRRKTLANSLGYHPFIGPLAPLMLQRAGVDGSRRPEQLTVSEYEGLAGTYHTLSALDIR